MNRLGLAGLLAGALALAGCVSVPSSGPVREVAPRGAEADFLVQVVPSGPEPGASPEQVVRGWLTAMQSFPLSTEVAREFLTDEAAQTWAPERGTEVYSTATVVPKNGGRVQLGTEPVSELSARGVFRPVPQAGGQITSSLRVQQTGAGWRIVDPPDILLVGAQFFEDYFRPFNLYFFDPTGEVLIADPVWMPLGDQLPTQLVRELFAGPTFWLRGQAQTTLPAPAGGFSVPLRSDGVAEVRLGEATANLSDTQRSQLAAQLTWTLSQVTGLVGVRLEVDGAELAVSGSGSVQTTESWQQFNPSGPRTRALLYGVRRGDLVAVDADAVTPVSQWWGHNEVALGEVSVERTLQRVAAVAGRRLIAGPYGAADRTEVQTWYEVDSSHRSLREPQWDRAGQLWVLDRDAGRSRLAVLDQGQSRPVPIGVLARSGISSFEVSPDGARVAALVQRWRGPYRGGAAPDRVRAPVLVIARVVRAGDGRTVRRLDKAYAVPVSQTGLRDLVSPSWASPSQVGVLARITRLKPQVYRLAIDGSGAEGGTLTGEALLAQVGADELAAAGVSTAQTVVGTRTGRLYVLDSDSEWSRLGDSLDIAHPRHPD